jgi:tripartite-type tricarboxylate transporter receptor subunit TctC
MTAMPWWRPAGHAAITIVLGCAACGASAQDAASSYPEKPVRLIDPFPPGGGSGLVARLVGQKLTETWSHPVVVDNRGGAGGSMGTDIAAKSVPDGYTILIGTASAMVINPHMLAAPYDPLRDFAPIVLATTIPLIIVVHPSIPAKTLRELIALARAQPGKLNFGSSGNGTISHLAGELFKNLTGAQIVQVPYKGGGPALIDLLGGQVQLTFNNILSALPQVRAEKIRALAVTSARRSPAVPEVPTAIESGVAGYEVVQWNGFFAPARTPRAIVVKLNRAMDQVLAQSDIRERLAGEGAEVAGGSAERFGAFVAAEYGKWGKVIREANIRSN